VIGVRQIVVDGVGDADHAHVPCTGLGLLVSLVGGVLGVVAAGVEEVADVVGLEDLEQTVHVLAGLLGVLLEINLVTAGAERGGGSVTQALDRAGLFIQKIDQIFIENSIDAVGAPINFLDELMPARFGDHTGNAGVDHDGWPP
jgi:hypothetical protein